jgi:hypothetical protein
MTFQLKLRVQPYSDHIVESEKGANDHAIPVLLVRTIKTVLQISERL